MIAGRAAKARFAGFVAPLFGVLSMAAGVPPAAEFALDPGAVDASGRLLAEAREGYTTLSWSAGDGDWIYELESAPTGAFDDVETRYTGPDVKSFVSGLEEGDHHFRVRARAADSDAWGPWSRPLVVPVRHHSLRAAAWLFAAGAALFGVTVAYIFTRPRHAVEEVPDG